MSANPYVTKKLAQASDKLTGNGVAGMIIWLICAYTTGLFLAQLGIPEPINYIIGGGIQWLFTKAEQPIWRGKGMPPLGIGVTIIDVAVNTTGVWPYIRDKLGATDLWTMIGDMTHDASPPTLLIRFLFAAIIGVAVAAGPEYFWSRED
jgi:hypothetical protein